MVALCMNMSHKADLDKLEKSQTASVIVQYGGQGV